MTTKYKTAGEIAQKVLVATIAACKVGAKIVEICQSSDKMIEDLTAPVYQKGKILKGIAFPTCVSVNHCMGHFSPLLSDKTVLNEGDVAKIDLGVHIDGYIAVVAHTIVVQANPEVPVTGKTANVIAAAQYAADAVLHTLKPGMKNTEVTESIQKVMDLYKCNAVEHVTSNQMKKFVICASKTIASRSTQKNVKVDTCTFEVNEVYAIDVVVSTGDGKGRELELKPTVYKRNVEQNYQLKLKTARAFFGDVNAKYPTLPFTIRDFEEGKAKLGLTECLQHQLLQPYPIIYEKEGEIVAQFKYTVLLLPSGVSRICGAPTALPTNIQPEFQLTDEIKEILSRTLKTKKAEKKKGESSASAAAGSAAAAAEEEAPALVAAKQ